MKNILVLGLAVSLCFHTYGLYRDSKKSSVLSIFAPPVTVSLTIGQYHIRLYGYSSPKAQITIEGTGIYDQTYADNNGYFEFTNLFSPFVPKETCLTAKDQFGRVTTPVCLPPFPTDYNISIGPVVMPPTLSLNNEYYFVGDQVVLSGQGIPSTNVNLSTFIDEKKSVLNYLAKFNPGDLIVKPVEAVTFPKVTAKTDSKGNFSVAIPSNHPEFYRLFAQSEFKNQQSPRSLTLNTKILPIWMIIIQFLLLLLNLIKGRFVELLVTGELLFLTYYLIRTLFLPHVISQKYALALRPDESLLIPEDHPLVELSDN